LQVDAPTQQILPSKHAVPEALNAVPHASPLQVATSQMPCVQVVLAPATQVPLPSHVLAAETTALAQLCGAHTVPEGQSSHAPVPATHAPFVPQLDAASAAHALPQHTPFEPHTPDVQSAPFIDGSHPAPGPPLPTHTPLAQWLPLEQSDVTVQLVAHVVPLHAYAPHAVVTAPAQFPLPSQRPAVTWEPAVHAAGEHVVDAPYFAQLPVLQVPSVPQLAAGWFAHTWRGSGVPSSASAHVPLGAPVSVSEHASHAPVHGALQQ
jgi:hypothetical protein